MLHSLLRRRQIRRRDKIKHTRDIFRIALPAIVSNITTPLLGLVDTAISGHLGAASYLGAIALGGTLFSTLYMLFGFLRMGTSGLTAQAYGSGDRKAEALALWRALAVGTIGAVALLALSPFAAEPVLKLMGPQDETTGELALQYFRIVVWGAPAVLCSYSLSGWFLGMQDSRAPMWMALVTNVVNIGVSLTLVYGLGLKIEGVALGTVVAQWCGAAYGAYIVWKHFKPDRVSASEITARGELGKYLRIHFDIFLRTCCLIAVTLWFTRSGARAGVDTLAANALLLQLFLLFSYFMDGFAFAGEALGGKFHGAGESGAVRSLVRELMITGLICAVAFGVAYMAGGELIFRLLSDDEGVRRTAVEYIWWAVALPFCGFTAFVMDGVMIGLTRTRGMLGALGVASIGFFALYYAGTKSGMGNHGLWLAFDAYLAIRGVVEYIIVRRSKV
ncbi:MAG: MATE family efflux transporter [Muribaculaceae bacterium]|nr:MATE family efflux transporter [Muribaculaceae bacterium]